MAKSTPRPMRERAKDYAERTATNPNGIWMRESMRAMLEEAWLAGYRAAARKRKASSAPA